MSNLDGMVGGRNGCSLEGVASHSPFHMVDSPLQPRVIDGNTTSSREPVPGVTYMERRGRIDDGVTASLTAMIPTG